MSCGVFDDVQLASIKMAADAVAESLRAEKPNDKLIVARAVFDIAAEVSVFEPEKLAEIARERLTKARGWSF